MNIREANLTDLDAIEKIYDDIHSAEEKGRQTIGWIRGVYPTRKTAEDSILRGDMFVLENTPEGSTTKDDSQKDSAKRGGVQESREILGAGIINQTQVDAYFGAPWEHDTDLVCVLHTLVISPRAAGRGYGRAFVEFYERWAKDHGLLELRLDTNARNTAARAMYRKLGYKEIGIVPTTFNGIPGVDLVLLEKSTG